MEVRCADEVKAEKNKTAKKTKTKQKTGFNFARMPVNLFQLVHM